MKISLSMVLLSFVAACNAEHEQKAASYRSVMSAEPAVSCAVERGEWCLLKTEYLRSLGPDPEENRFILIISEDFWADEFGVVIESAACGRSRGQSPEIVEQDADFVWNQMRWRMIALDFGGSPSCTLRLLAPLKSRAKLDMAASVLSSNIAYCETSHPCHPQLLTQRLFETFKELAVTENDITRIGNEKGFFRLFSGIAVLAPVVKR